MALSRFVYVGELCALSREDMAAQTPSFVPTLPAERLRDSHRRVARLAAQGLRNRQIAEATGFCEQRVWQLLRSPAMIELVEHFRGLVDSAFAHDQDHYYSIARSNMVKAERMISDRLEEADLGEVKISVKDLKAIARDAADRFGYGKRKTEIRATFSFAEKMEAAQRRSNEPKELEHEG